MNITCSIYRQLLEDFLGTWYGLNCLYCATGSVLSVAFIHEETLITTSGSVPFHSVPDRSGFSCIPKNNGERYTTVDTA